MSITNDINRPALKKFTKHTHINDYPLGTHCDAGHLVQGNGSWRVFIPTVDESKCVYCLHCFLLCPEGTVSKAVKGKTKLSIDYTFCKGCGICSHECKKGAITMQKDTGITHEP